MNLVQPTPEEEKAAKRSLNFTLLTVVIICFTAIFCFSKMERTTTETEHVAELAIQKNKSETALLLARKGIASPDYRPVVISDVGSNVLNTSYNCTLSPRWNIVNYSVSINAALTLSGGQTGTVILQSSPDNSTWTTICTAVNGNTGSLTIGLNTLNSQTVQMIGAIQPNYFYRLSSSGTATMSVVGGREIAF